MWRGYVQGSDSSNKEASPPVVVLHLTNSSLMKGMGTRFILCLTTICGSRNTNSNTTLIKFPIMIQQFIPRYQIRLMASMSSLSNQPSYVILNIPFRFFRNEIGGLTLIVLTLLKCVAIIRGTS